MNVYQVKKLIRKIGKEAKKKGDRASPVPHLFG
jgi:hypothetical protein